MQVNVTTEALLQEIGSLTIQVKGLNEHINFQAAQLAEQAAEIAQLRDTCDKLACQLPSSEPTT